ncbi:MAG: HEPN domain-containing protein [Epsilonproteobacteria bacterium]|nr:HEPN domain-containing protein [Campylobacterota bacterium]
MNEISAKEWLKKAWHNLSGAKLFYESNHYSDVTAVEIHYAVEKALKAFLAYENRQILKTHDLVRIYKLVSDFINLDDKLDLLDKITKYHIEEAYPTFNRPLPSRAEIKEVLDFAQELFERVCDTLDINADELK